MIYVIFALLLPLVVSLERCSMDFELDDIANAQRDQNNSTLSEEQFDVRDTGGEEIGEEIDHASNRGD